MGFVRIDGGWRYDFGGLKTNTAADEMPPTKHPYALNVRKVKSLQTRPGYELLFTTVTPPPVGCTSLTWTPETQAFNTTWDDVAWAPELPLFCAIGNSSTQMNSQTSPDGVTWTRHNLGVLGYVFDSICWSPDLMLFCAVDSSVGAVATSPDGVTWTQQTPADAFSWFSVCWSSDLGLFCAVGYDGNTTFLGYSMTSPDGVNWTSHAQPGTGNQNSNAVIWVSELNLFVAVGGDFDLTYHFVYTSPDGANWTPRATPANDNNWTGVAYSPSLNLLCAVGASGSGVDNRTMHSADGITWVLGTVPASTPGNGTYSAIAWSDTLALFAATGFDDGTGSGTGVLSHSSDGITFTLDTKPFSGGWFAITNGEPLAVFVTVGDNESLADTHGQLLATCADT